MKRMWKRKWLVAGGALVIFLSIGTVAWATSGPGNGPAGAPPANAGAAVLAVAGTGETDAISLEAFKAKRAALKEKCERFIQRQKALFDLVRDKMSPADQATYDQLVQQAKDQREALQKAGADLRSTMKELHDLTQKYIDAQTGSTSTTATSTQ
ncbi:MAG TPA: hypothetical protein VJP78_11800 [Thermoleophilia bacterium]|nr:hypothetical protein [Thermoleophilia bacterium]